MYIIITAMYFHQHVHHHPFSLTLNSILRNVFPGKACVNKKIQDQSSWCSDRADACKIPAVQYSEYSSCLKDLRNVATKVLGDDDKPTCIFNNTFINEVLDFAGVVDVVEVTDIC